MDYVLSLAQKNESWFQLMIKSVKSWWQKRNSAATLAIEKAD